MRILFEINRILVFVLIYAEVCNKKIFGVDLSLRILPSGKVPVLGGGGGGARLLVTGAVDALAKSPLQVFVSDGLEHIVPQSHSGAVVSFTGEVKAIGGKV